MIEILLLVSALCVDEMLASIAYGADGIRIRMRDMLLMNLVSSGFLGVSWGVGLLFSGLISEQLARAVGFVCLLFLGGIKLADYFIKAYINRHARLWKNISFSVSGLRFMISIYGNPAEADKDASRTLSVKETLFLSCAMSIDSLAVGTMAAFLGGNLLLSVLLTFLIGFFCVFAGYQAGKGLAVKSKRDLSWLCGIFLILLAFTKLFSFE